MQLIINGETIDDSLIRQEANSLRPRYEMEFQHMDPVERELQLREWSKENVIEKILLRQEALRDPDPVPDDEIESRLAGVRAQTPGEPGCDPSVDEGELRKEIEISLRVEKLLAKVTAKTPRPKTKEIAEFYRSHKDEFWQPELIHAAHVVKNVGDGIEESQALDAIKKAEEELASGADFRAIADKYSDCAGNGGDLGLFPRGEMVEEFENVVFDLPVGKRSDIFKSPFGFHIAMVFEKRPEGTRPLDEVRNQIEAVLLQEHQNKAVEDFIDRLKERAKVETLK